MGEEEARPLATSNTKQAFSISDSTDGNKQKERCRIMKNVAGICVAFMLNFTAFSTMQNLQSSLNLAEGLGTAGLTVIYASILFSVLFLPSPVISVLGCKWTMVLGVVPYIIYMAANFHATWWTIMPAAALLGVGAILLWTAESKELTTLGKRYAELTGSKPEVSVTRVLGVFYMSYNSAQVWGSLVAAFILLTRPEGEALFPDLPDSQLEWCGAAWCGDGVASANNTNLDPPDVRKIYTLCGTFVALGVLALVVLILFVDGRRPTTDDTSQTRRCHLSCGLALATVKHLQHKKQLLLIPLSLYTGLEQAFIAGDFTKSYVSCTLGIWAVGLIVIAYATTNTVSCLLLSISAKYLKRMYIFSFGAVLHLGAQVTLLLWKPNTHQVAVLFVLAGAWGAAGAVWNSQLMAMYGCIFPNDLEAGFSNHFLWQSIGYIMTFAYSSYLCTYVKLYILIAVLVLGMIGFFTVEIGLRKHVD